MSNFSKAIKQSAKVQSAVGFGIVLLGVLAMFTPFYTGMVFSSLLAICVAGASLAGMIYAFTADSTGQKVLQFILGGIGLVAAYFIFQLPVSSLYALTVTVIAFLIADGLLTLYAAYRNRGQDGNGWTIVSALSSFILSGLLIADWPLSGLYAIGMFIGIRLMISGWTLAMLGFVEHKVGDDLEDVNLGDPELNTY